MVLVVLLLPGISEGVIEENLEKIKSSADWLALDLVQIDDGFSGTGGRLASGEWPFP